MARSKSKYLFCLLAFLTLALKPLSADESEPLNFSILFQGGAGKSSGFLGSGDPAPEGGLWLGISLSDRFDGLWGLDFFTLPNQPVTVTQTPNSNNNFISSFGVQPTDDFALSVNTRWYWADKFDYVHHRFNTVPYLLLGGGMDLVVDEPPPPTNPGVTPPITFFYNKSYDMLFSINLGAGIDLPFDKQWMFYVEGLDHLIVWEGLTQIVALRAGVKVMLDAAHLDPFR
jgi:hypothetical protein